MWQIVAFIIWVPFICILAYGVWSCFKGSDEFPDDRVEQWDRDQKLIDTIDEGMKR